MDEPTMRVHWKGAQRHAPSQTERCEQLLHDPPKKRGLMYVPTVSVGLRFVAAVIYFFVSAASVHFSVLLFN